MNLDTYRPEEQLLKVVIKGEPGTRKSTHAATFPGPIRWLDIDRKIESLFLPKKLGFIDSVIDFERFNNWYGIEKELQRLEVNCNYKTVVLDTLTSLGDVINRQTLGDKGGQDKGKKIGGIRVNSIEDYSAETSALMYMVEIGKKINAHFILIAHVIQRDEKDATGRSKVSRQLVTGGKVVGAKIPAYFPEVYHFSFEEQFDTSMPPNYVMYTQPHGGDFARTALPLPYKVDITKRRLYDVIKEAQSQLITSVSETNEQPTELTTQKESW